ncbi:MAG: diguanylate cyclase [Acidobacteria bacterium]|nr:diguanylate cyclase [Acidobacteriota bacterium]
MSRAIAALRKPGLATSAVKEFVAAERAPGNANSLEKLICGLHDLTISRGLLAYPEVSSAPELQAWLPLLADLSARSLVALPLNEGNDHLGLLVLIDSNARSWSQNEVLVLRMIAEQTTIALSNAGLRRLVKNLSVTDENSGLLKRASYLDLLMGEVRRARQQNTPLSVLLMRFADRGLQGKDPAEGAEGGLQRLGQLVVANLRQNDLAFRYAADIVAVVLGETAEKEALMVIEKMRRVIGAAVAEKVSPQPFNAGVAEAVLHADFDPVDIVTELINRVERALEKAIEEGPGKAVALPANVSAAAVA